MKTKVLVGVLGAVLVTAGITIALVIRNRYWDGGPYSGPVFSVQDGKVTKAAHDELRNCGFGDDTDQRRQIINWSRQPPGFVSVIVGTSESVEVLSESEVSRKRLQRVKPGEKTSTFQIEEIDTGVYLFDCE